MHSLTHSPVPVPVLQQPVLVLLGVHAQSKLHQAVAMRAA